MNVKLLNNRVTAICLIFVILILLSSCSSKSSTDPTEVRDQFASLAQARNYAGALLNKPIPRFDGDLVDMNGMTFNQAKQTQGEVTLVFFGYTSCPDVCPTTMATLADARRQLPTDVAQKVKVLFITVDPKRDTGAVMKAWLSKFDTSFIGLTGSESQLKSVEQAYGIPPEVIEGATPDKLDYFVDHFSGIFVYSPDDAARLIYPPSGVTPSTWASDLLKLSTKGFQL